MRRYWRYNTENYNSKPRITLYYSTQANLPAPDHLTYRNKNTICIHMVQWYTIICTIVQHYLEMIYLYFLYQIFIFINYNNFPITGC